MLHLDLLGTGILHSLELPVDVVADYARLTNRGSRIDEPDALDSRDPVFDGTRLRVYEEDLEASPTAHALPPWRSGGA